MQLARLVSVGAVGRDEGREGYGAGVGEKEGDLLPKAQSACLSFFQAPVMHLIRHSSSL